MTHSLFGWDTSGPAARTGSATTTRPNRTATTRISSLLLETERSRNDWFEVERGSAQKIIEAVAQDTTGTFHGLGALDRSLRRVEGGRGRLEVEMGEDLTFSYNHTGETCTVQEALYHFAGAPIDVIAEPRVWYWYHRRPRIVEVSEDREQVLVEFLAMSLRGGFGGRCLYAVRDDIWGVYVIKPNQSESISSALAWLRKRKWEDWGA